ncbi:MAG TPA: aldo/keto reductase [Sulfuricaulis sp.]|nr:aldo/keto reductase [Sulfuricaulis sp.]
MSEMEKKPIANRRAFLKQLGGMGAALLFMPRAAIAAEQPVITKPIPATGERLPVIGMGTWITFDVGNNSYERAVRARVMQAFFDNGGALIDSSPMYGSSEEVIGEGLKTIKNRDRLFAATKVWILGKRSGIRQMEDSQKLWGVPRFDLMQIHNMLDWETHWETLREWKAAGRVRYVGITTSHGSRHDAMVKAMERTPFDFVQFTYSLEDRSVEQRLLPLAQERGMAVIINRPFDGGDLFRRVRGKPLPPWAAEFDCRNWAQYFLKFIVSHPAVTCAIPATSKVDHMVENMGAGFGRLPNAEMRRRMVEYFERL